MMTPKQRVQAAFPNAVCRVSPHADEGYYIYFTSDEKIGVIPVRSGSLGEGATPRAAWLDAATRQKV